MGTQSQEIIEVQMRKHLTESAFEFLERAVDEFEDDPKYSIIHFCSAVEQFLKARLMMEHWTLIVEGDKYNWNLFRNGDFKSIDLKSCLERLAKITNTKLSKSTVGAFIELSQHRNKVIHFYHEDLLQQKTALAQESTRCWFQLHQLLKQQWEQQFDEYSFRIDSIERKMKVYDPYLEEVFKRLTPLILKLTKSAVDFQKCQACGCKSFQCEWSEESEVEHECLVCGLQAGNDTIGHCAGCDSVDSVVQVGTVFYCIECHQFYSTMESCDHCGASSTSLPQDSDGGGDVSAWLGCVVCDGHNG